jgi:hypothetical protein
METYQIVAAGVAVIALILWVILPLRQPSELPRRQSSLTRSYKRTARESPIRARLGHGLGSDSAQMRGWGLPQL